VSKRICRSPDISEVGARASMGGWGLGEGGEEAGRTGEEEEEEGLDWDQAQAMVERMIGITPDNHPLHPLS
jgi:hypothetical protein